MSDHGTGYSVTALERLARALLFGGLAVFALLLSAYTALLDLPAPWRHDESRALFWPLAWRDALSPPVRALWGRLPGLSLIALGIAATGAVLLIWRAVQPRRARSPVAQRLVWKGLALHAVTLSLYVLLWQVRGHSDLGAFRFGESRFYLSDLLASVQDLLVPAAWVALGTAGVGWCLRSAGHVWIAAGARALSGLMAGIPLVTATAFVVTAMPPLWGWQTYDCGTGRLAACQGALTALADVIWCRGVSLAIAAIGVAYFLAVRQRQVSLGHITRLDRWLGLVPAKAPPPGIGPATVRERVIAFWHAFTSYVPLDEAR